MTQPKPDFTAKAREICTYYSDTDSDIGGEKGGSTAGYLLSEEQFNQLTQAHLTAVREAKIEELEALIISKPHHVMTSVNVADHSAIWQRITERLDRLKAKESE